jgi:nucleoid DNA-binding protein
MKFLLAVPRYFVHVEDASFSKINKNVITMAKKRSTLDKKYTKTQIVEHIAEETELTKAQVNSVIESLGGVINLHVKKRSVGEFVLPGILKIMTVSKPAVKARKGINPFTKEEQMFKAKPATTVVKVRPLKGLKDMAV